MSIKKNLHPKKKEYNDIKNVMMLHFGSIILLWIVCKDSLVNDYEVLFEWTWMYYLSKESLTLFDKDLCGGKDLDVIFQQVNPRYLWVIIEKDNLITTMSKGCDLCKTPNIKMNDIKFLLQIRERKKGCTICVTKFTKFTIKWTKSYPWKCIL